MDTIEHGDSPTPQERLNAIPKGKLIRYALLALVAVAVILTLLAYVSSSRIVGYDTLGIAPSMPSSGYSKGYAMNEGVAMDAAMERADYDSMIAPVPEPIGGSIGDDAEEYESLSYSATVKSADHTTVCDTIESWKPLPYVVFEYASRGDSGCRYTFKVERDQAAAMLDEVEALEPSDLTQNTETLKRQVVEYDSQLAILLKREEHLKSTLQQAVAAYDEVTTLATRVEDAEVLSTIIRNRINDIKRLTDEQITLSRQIDSVVRRSAELQDRIEYVSFSLYVQKYEILDGDRIKDRWVLALQKFVSSVNETIVALTLGLITNLLNLLVVVVYVAIVVTVAVMGWHVFRRYTRR
jgi:hypothetical protein